MNKKPGRKSNKPTKEQFKYLYYTLDCKAEDIAKQYGVKTQTVWNWAQQYKKEKK